MRKFALLAILTLALFASVKAEEGRDLFLKLKVSPSATAAVPPSYTFGEEDYYGSDYSYRSNGYDNGYDTSNYGDYSKRFVVRPRVQTVCCKTSEFMIFEEHADRRSQGTLAGHILEIYLQITPGAKDLVGKKFAEVVRADYCVSFESMTGKWWLTPTASRELQMTVSFSFGSEFSEKFSKMKLSDFERKWLELATLRHETAEMRARVKALRDMKYELEEQDDLAQEIGEIGHDLDPTNRAIKKFIEK